MDSATPIGLFIASILLALILGFEELLHLSTHTGALTFVVAAVTAALCLHLSFGEMGQGIRSLKAIMQLPTLKIRDLPGLFAGYAVRARAEGLLCLENEAVGVGDSGLVLGVQLAADGLDETGIRRILDAEGEGVAHRLTSGMHLMRWTGVYLAAAGLAGTFVSGVSATNDGMRSLLPLAWGAGLSLLFFPIAGKLSARIYELSAIRKMVTEGVCGLASGENPRMLEKKLLVTLAPTDRESLFGP
ncbi:MAG: hypothetical protein MI742_16985 [Desulfobacterales bacterium]|nr:hypothetical protein [Desulfobacterales bacterium]